MDKNIPFILSIVGESDSGKTTLILKLLPELKRKGYKVAVAKHCPRGFDLDVQGKDSWRFTQAGGEGIFLSSDKDEAIMRLKKDELNMGAKLKNYFSDFDIVLMEGYNHEPGIKKMRIIRSGMGAQESTSDETIACVSDMQLNTDKPVYKPGDISGIISFIESLIDI